ncbi:NAD-dependent epimerase/dehydratase family protein [Candidatus Pelagibacter bacterium]|jgi:CDP-paratose 2-epimerase|nr:NAD-dependent epimerase/dehydratase family protein [Candidatus Pelagibacter bacterium]|tara:strand:- start:160 stop:1185 length:1026 start_codon:yes stop_codon:yes gene_type:complete
MKILITGGCGFVGSNIAIYLKKKLKKAKIFSLDNLTRKGSILNRNRLKNHKIKNFNINIEKFEKIENLPKFDLVIDCCAEPAIEASRKDPDRVFKTNLIGTFNILKKCVRDNANIIFLSSSRVYSINKLRSFSKNLNISRPLKVKRKIDENFETTTASSLYGFTKLASEKLICEIFFNTKLKYIINRFGVIAGPWQFGKQDQGFVPLWVAKHYLKKKLSYIGFGGYGNQVRDVIHIDDVCEIIFIQIAKIKKINNETFNIGGGLKSYVSLRDLTSKCQKITGNKIKIKKVSKTSIFDIPYYITDNKKIKKFYNWEPLKNINIVLKDIYKWLYQNKKLRKFF